MGDITNSRISHYNTRVIFLVLAKQRGMCFNYTCDVMEIRSRVYENQTAEVGSFVFPAGYIHVIRLLNFDRNVVLALRDVSFSPSIFSSNGIPARWQTNLIMKWNGLHY